MCLLLQRSDYPVNAITLKHVALDNGELRLLLHSLASRSPIKRLALIGHTTIIENLDADDDYEQIDRATSYENVGAFPHTNKHVGIETVDIDTTDVPLRVIASILKGVEYARLVFHGEHLPTNKTMRSQFEVPYVVRIYSIMLKIVNLNVLMASLFLSAK